MDWPGWEEDVLAAARLPATSENVAFLSAWHPYEQSACANNPLNTKEPWTGGTNCLPNGVKRYDTQAHGAAATAATLKDGFYPNLLAALREGNPYTYADPAAVAQDITTWGTPNFATAYLNAAGGTQPGQTAPQTQASATASGTRGYTDFRWSVASHLHAHIVHSRRTGAATLRTLAHRRKVKG